MSISQYEVARVADLSGRLEPRACAARYLQGGAHEAFPAVGTHFQKAREYHGASPLGA